MADPRKNIDGLLENSEIGAERAGRGALFAAEDPYACATQGFLGRR